MSGPADAQVATRANLKKAEKNNADEDDTGEPRVAGSGSTKEESKLTNASTSKEADIKVSDRMWHTMRSSDCKVHWFESTGAKEIHSPPPISPKAGLQENDLYLHRVLDKDVQAWRYEARVGKAGYHWVPTRQGAQVNVLDRLGRPRYFVLTGKAQKPSFVTSGTMSKNYATVEPGYDGEMAKSFVNNIFHQSHPSLRMQRAEAQRYDEEVGPTERQDKFRFADDITGRRGGI
ncbi:hypothetical protein K474DRAFT_1680990 [Panus rudis PR-1116 ss-1]|nr:hypothetical protein K474DRAFT_1680990 [Panus rudis PR-1116 ss-1]